MNTLKQSGFLVHRSFMLPGMGVDDVSPIQTCLQALPGMQQVVFDVARHKVALNYDAGHLGFWQIEQTLRDAGWPLATGRWARMHYAWYRYLDENAHTNAEGKGGACCSNPSDIYAKRHK